MKKHRRSARCLAIIGNGFDLAHGLKTTYWDFVTATGMDFFAAFRNLLVEYCGTDLKWYEFENRISELTLQCFQRELSGEETAAAQARDDLDRINKQFQTFHKKLADYLASAACGADLRRLPNIRRQVSRRTLGISFNYTDTAEHYMQDVLYVHGSLAENDILLGYDFRDEPCIAGYDEMQWSKDTCRAQLAFRRYLRQTLHLEPKDPLYLELLSNFQEILALRLSNRGFEDGDITGWSQEGTLRRYLAWEASHASLLSGVSLHRVRKIIVLGHSIASDQVYLQEILKQCPKLRKVVLFSYAGESQGAWGKKADFFRPYCKKIRKVMYR